MKPTRQDVELYVIGAYDGDVAALEQAIADDPEAHAMLTDEAAFEGVLREAATAAKFCVACGDLVRAARCDACGAAVAPGGYVVERVLVSNAHGRMYVARDADGKRVALKELAFVLPPSLATIAAFEREATFLRALEHPAIPRFVASFREGDGVHVRYYLAQELVVGEALDAHLDEHFYTEAEVTDIARQVLAVLVYLQGLSPMVIHRDIKPANLIKRADGTIAVVDFGAAYAQGSTVGSTTIGTFGYMPVEQLAGLIDATTDPYALGSTLLHLLTRKEPWRLMQGAGFEAVNVSRSMLAFLRKLTAPDAQDRFANAAAALAALDGRTAIVPRKPRRRRIALWSALAAAAMVTSGGVGAYIAVSQPDEPYPYDRYAPALMAQFKDQMCRCKDRSCADLVTENMTAEFAKFVDRRAFVVSDEDTELLARLTKEYGDCAARIYGVADQVVRAPQIDVDPPGLLHYGDSLPPGRAVDLDVKAAPIHDVLRMLAQQCSTSLVVPDSVGASVTVHFKQAPCDQALEVLVETHGLAYTYDAAAKLLRVGTRKQLDAEQALARKRAAAGITDDDLLPGRGVDLDVKDMALHDALQAIANAGGVNVVIPDSVGGNVTVRLHNVAWVPALRAVLASQGLGYRYRSNGKLLRIGRQAEIDADAQRDCQPPGQVDPFDTRPVCGNPVPHDPHALITLRIKSQPWATAEVEGGQTCDTPCAMRLPPGTYTVRLRNADQHMHAKRRVTLSNGAHAFDLDVDLEDD